MSDKNKQSIEQLRKRFDDLRDRRTTAQANLRTIEATLADLKTQAREQFGSDDPAELARKLERTRAQNGKLRADYQDHLDGIDMGLAELEPSEGGRR